MSDRWSKTAEREELELSDIMTECLAIFEGGDIREDFENPWVLFVIEDMVDSFRRIKALVKERKEMRDVFSGYITSRDTIFEPLPLFDDGTIKEKGNMTIWGDEEE